MPALVLDASAALRLVLDPAGQHAIAAHLGLADAVYAPALFASETANALWKLVRAGQLTGPSALRMQRHCFDLVDRCIDDAELLPEALVLAIDLDHPVYDALYLVAARRMGAKLLSFDRKLLRLADRLDIPPVAGS
jgi:predicted nucleic acid-binding protein